MCRLNKILKAKISALDQLVWVFNKKNLVQNKEFNTSLRRREKSRTLDPLRYQPGKLFFDPLRYQPGKLFFDPLRYSISLVSCS